MRLLLAAGLLGMLAGCGNRDTAPPSVVPVESEAGESVDPETRDVWLERLEVASRELYSAREAVVAAVGIEPGDWVGDIGAGTGLYSLLFAEQVGETGRVFAEDIEPSFLDLITRRVDDAGITNVTAVLGLNDDVTLPRAAFDIMFIADTYHYFDNREAIMRTIYDALKPAGRLVMVEYEVTPGEERRDYAAHVRFGKASVTSELEFIGFQFVGAPSVEGLSENYFLVMRKPETIAN